MLSCLFCALLLGIPFCFHFWTRTTLICCVYSHSYCWCILRKATYFICYRLLFLISGRGKAFVFCVVNERLQIQDEKWQKKWWCLHIHIRIIRIMSLKCRTWIKWAQTWKYLFYFCCTCISVSIPTKFHWWNYIHFCVK